jgi:DNA-binding NarL/FixJ family response regulator
METTHEKIIRVVIVDDHRLFNDGLHSMLQSQPGIEVAAQIYDSRLAEEKIVQLIPDVALIDFNMPHINGIELTKMLIAKNAKIKIVILSMYNEELYVENFKRHGCKGYLFKTATVEEVALAIKEVHAGGLHFPKSNPKSNHADDLFLKKLKLTPREKEVIAWIKRGMTTKEIAQKLDLSYYTVETHRKNIKVKIGIEGEAGFLKFVYEYKEENN